MTPETSETADQQPQPPPAQRAALDSHFRPGTYAATDPDRPAVITSAGVAVSFAELEQRSCRLAQALFDHGLRPGDHVAMLLPNDDRTHEIVFGAQRSGLYFTMVNTHLTAEEAAYIVDDCGARTLVTSARLGELTAEMVPLTPAVELRLMVGRGTGDPRRNVDYDDFVGRYPAEPLAMRRRAFRCCTPRAPRAIRRACGGP